MEGLTVGEAALGLRLLEVPVLAGPDGAHEAVEEEL